tara:strand:- start:75 stop:839 length:765 start_codon:yes stop_codon:yes gene_type:complete
MAYIGQQPANKIITSADMEDGLITTAKIADDAATADKIANSVNSAITANTSKTTNATHSGEVTGATALTITDNIVDEANLKVSNTPTNGYFLSAQSGNTGGLTWAEAGGGNTPYFEGYSAGDQNVADGTITKAVLGTEAQDSDSKFTDSRFTPTVAGRYYIEGQVFGGSTQGQGDVAAVKTLIYFNGSAYKSSSVHNENSSSQSLGNQCVPVSAIITFDTDDYVELYGYVDRGSSQAKFFAGTKSTYLLGYKIG